MIPRSPFVRHFRVHGSAPLYWRAGVLWVYNAMRKAHPGRGAFNA